MLLIGSIFTMFDGTDLSMAYGSMYEAPAAPSPSPPPAQEMPMSAPVPKATASHAMPPEQSYLPPQAMYAQQPIARYAHIGDNFWDKLIAKKWEVIKLVMLSLVVLLGMSFDKVATHYLDAYIGRAILSDTQEFLVRVSYPISVILVLWVIKASA
jgi:hypothetical protein